MDEEFDFDQNENISPNEMGIDVGDDGQMEGGDYADEGGGGNGSGVREEPSMGDDSQLPGVDDLPLFAGPEERKLHLEIKEKEESIDKVADNIADLTERVKVMKEHFKNVQQELQHTNQLQGAKLNEIRSEKHLKQLTSRSLGGHKIEAKRLESELMRLQDSLNDVQSQIFSSNQKLDEFKMQMNWNAEELEQWSLLPSRRRRTC